MAKLDFNPDPHRILPPIGFDFGQEELKKKKSEKKGKLRRSIFSSQVEEAEKDFASSALNSEQEGEEHNLSSLLDSIHSFGDLLKNDSSLENLAQYREAVGKFLHFIVKKSYTVDEAWVRKSVLEKKKLSIVRLVDQKLEGLARGILSGQKEGLNLLARIEEINGLLVNLLH